MQLTPSCFKLMRAALPAWLVLGACVDPEPGVGWYYAGGYGDPCAATDPVPAQSTIDTGAGMTPALAGDETGLFIEYYADDTDGVWELTVSCDTRISGYACFWDVYATVHWGSAAYDADLVGYDDYVGWYDYPTAVLSSDTAYELDGFVLYTEPGVPVQFEVYLDGYSGQRYTYWVGDGAVHRGAPTNPIDLVPSS